MRKTLRKIVNVLDGQPTGARGQSLVEMTLTFPILILMILGLAEIGFLANNYLILMDVARDSARFAVSLDPRSPAWTVGDAKNLNRLRCDPQDGLGSWLLPNSKNRSNATGPLLHVSPMNPAVTGTYPYNNNPEQSNLGFFDGVMCHALFILPPIIFNDDANAKDDIAISVVSYSVIDYTYLDGLDSTAVKANYKNGTLYGSTNDPGDYWLPAGNDTTRVTVTGRWPLESRYCNNGGNGDFRDPFDFLRAKYLNSLPVKKLSTGYDSHAVTDFSGSDPNYNELGYYSTAPFTYANYLTNVNQGVRGYILTGKHQAPDGCYGSDFTVQQIETFLNGPTNDPTNRPFGFRSGLVSSNATNGSLVIFEIHWQHHPFVFGPLFNGWQSGTGNDPILYIYSIFPVTAAQPTSTPVVP